MVWWLAYVLLLLVLFVRLQTPGAPSRPPVRASPDEPLGIVRLHHALFYVILLGAPLEALLAGGAPRWRLVGLVLFAAGVALYRIAGAALGGALSPLVTPRPGASHVTAGPYRVVRHPMYLGQALIALGAPLTLGARWVACLALPAAAVLLWRSHLEDVALERARAVEIATPGELR